MKLIGIHGFKGSGKTTAAKMIQQFYRADGKECGVTNYGDPLKQSLAALRQVPLDWYYDEKQKEESKAELDGNTPRKDMTNFHDALVPVFGDDVFVSPIKRKAKELEAAGKVDALIIGDVRYEGRETDWIRRREGVILHVKRPGVVAGSHSSETGVIYRPGDLLLFNDKEVEDMRGQLWVWYKAGLL